MNDEQKTREQLLDELRELRGELDRLRLTRQAANVSMPIEVLEKKVNEYVGWF